MKAPLAPGFAPWPRHMVVRANDLLEYTEPDVLAALARRGVPVVDRSRPAGSGVQAVVTSTRAGTVVTLEQRTGRRNRRGRCLRALTAELDNIAEDLINHAPGSHKAP